MSPNYALRTARESLNLSMHEVADGARVSFRTVQRAEKGHPLNPGSRRRLCDFFAQFGITAGELCLVPQRRQSGVVQQPSGSLDVSEAMVRGMLVAMRNLEQEGIDMNRSRRFFLQMLGVVGTALIIAPKELLLPSTALTNSPITEVSVSTIENFAAITQQYRSLQLAGFATEDVLRSHIGLIQNALENTVNDKYRCDLWRILAQSQILARHSITKKQELGRARTWNEAAIASAQYSGDALLLGAAIGHLGHLCLTWQHDPLSARKFLDQAQDYTHGHPVNGWFAMVVAAIAAEEENRSECEASVARATEIVRGMPTTPEYADLFYTDFNISGTDAFAGNCLLKVGEPTRALERLTSMNLEALAENRHASAFYDISCAHAATGELEAMEVYAFRSIDKALTTHRFYILPRFVTLAQKIQAKDHHESHAAAVAAYAHVALHQ
jgi:transcriptional regulator with XRE-family HTH domain